MDWTRPLLEERREGWDVDKLAAALQTGRDREDFLVDLEAAFKSKREQCVGWQEAQFLDDWGRDWMQRVREVRLRHFGRRWRPEPDFEVRLVRERERFLRELAAATEKLADEWDHFEQWTGYDETYSVLKERVHRLNKSLRSWRRRRAAIRRDALEQDIRAAWRVRDFATMPRLSHVLGGRGVGVKKRLWLHLPSYRPLAQEVRAWVAQPGGAGGMSAQEVTDWADE